MRHHTTQRQQQGQLGQASGVNDQVCTSDEGGEEAARADSCLGWQCWQDKLNEAKPNYIETPYFVFAVFEQLVKCGV